MAKLTEKEKKEVRKKIDLAIANMSDEEREFYLEKQTYSMFRKSTLYSAAYDLTFEDKGKLFAILIEQITGEKSPDIMTGETVSLEDAPRYLRVPIRMILRDIEEDNKNWLAKCIGGKMYGEARGE